jgi:hypothetical protein
MLGDSSNCLNIFEEFIEKCGKEEDIKETQLSRPASQTTS